MTKREDGRGRRINAIAQRVKDAVFGDSEALTVEELREAMTGTIGVLAAMIHCDYHKSAELPGHDTTLKICEAMKAGAEAALDEMEHSPEQAAINRLATVMGNLSNLASDGGLDIEKLAVLISEHAATNSAEDLLAENPIGGIKSAQRAVEVSNAFFDAALESLRAAADDGKRYDNAENN